MYLIWVSACEFIACTIRPLLINHVLMEYVVSSDDSSEGFSSLPASLQCATECAP